MSLTPIDPEHFLPKDQIVDIQLDNAVDNFARAQRTPQQLGPSLSSEVLELKRRMQEAEGKVTGLRDFWRDVWVPRYWNPSCDRLEAEIGMERLSNPKTNLLPNAGFRLWNAAVNLPLGWTATNAPTISRVAARTGAFGGNYAVRVASGASAGSISRVVKVKGGAIHRLTGWLYFGAAASATISMVTNGASPVTASIVIPAATVGAGGWFHFPRAGWDALSIQTPADATQVTVTLQVDANKTCDFSDFQLVQGPQADADMWEPAPEDIESVTGLGALPGGYGSSGQHLQTDGAGTTSWATPTVNAAAVVKVQDESTATDVVLSNDAILLLAVAAGEVCSFRAVLYVKAALATTGIQVAMTCPAGGVINYGVGRYNLTAQEFYGFSAASGGAIDIVAASWATTGQGMVVIEGSLIAGSAGNLVVQWAQSTTSGTNLTVAAGSSLSKVKQ